VDSLYSKYLAERTGDKVHETSQGFVSYRFIDKSVYIIDIYVLPDFRKTGVAASLADKVVDIARLKGCTELLGSVVPSTRNSTDSLKVLLGYGMTLKSSSDNFIIFSKEIK
jgi:GNAT superfamily N-acetyltransferase